MIICSANLYCSVYYISCALVLPWFSLASNVRSGSSYFLGECSCSSVLELCDLFGQGERVPQLTKLRETLEDLL